MSFTSANRKKILVLWVVTSYILVGVSMYQRNMLPPSSGSEWVGRECSQMETCPTDNFYHSNHFNPRNMTACFSEIFVNITWGLQPEYSLLWKQMLCVGHVVNMLQITYPKTLREITNILCDACYFILSSLQKKYCDLSCNIHIKPWRECSTFYSRTIIGKGIHIIRRKRERERGGGGNSTLISVLGLMYPHF